MKKMFFISFLSLFILSGCGKEYVYVKPSYPVLKYPKKVEPLHGKIKNGCLYLDNHNTNLCGDDLKIILKQFKKYQINEKFCTENIESYNKFIKSKNHKGK